MITYIKRRNSNGEELSRKKITDNWFTVYQSSAKMEGRRINWLNPNCYEVIYSEKDYTITLSKEMEEK